VEIFATETGPKPTARNSSCLSVADDFILISGEVQQQVIVINSGSLIGSHRAILDSMNNPQNQLSLNVKLI